MCPTRHRASAASRRQGVEERRAPEEGRGPDSPARARRLQEAARRAGEAGSSEAGQAVRDSVRLTAKSRGMAAGWSGIMTTNSAPSPEATNHALARLDQGA